MSKVTKTEIISTASSIETLDIPEGERNRVLANLAVANTVVGTFFAAAKWLNLR